MSYKNTKYLRHGEKVEIGSNMYVFEETEHAITCDGCAMLKDGECMAPPHLKCQGSWKLGIPSGILKEV